MMGIQGGHRPLQEGDSSEKDKQGVLPEGHYLRRIKEEVDFSYVYEAVQHLYAQIGRRSTDPVLLLKMQVLGCLEGITSERRLEREIRGNAGYRWFLDIESPEDVPDHSTLSRNRNERFGRVGLYRDLLNRAMKEIAARGLSPTVGSTSFGSFSSTSSHKFSSSSKVRRTS
ncbi:transposase [Pasteuria penetrans]|uniref:transposase n=1 Tax=Pasteuria penetrans TaxID=86005 RepID=UPI000F95814A|nr:transposase [Pasteuria penetrans]